MISDGTGWYYNKHYDWSIEQLNILRTDYCDYRVVAQNAVTWTQPKDGTYHTFRFPDDPDLEIELVEQYPNLGACGVFSQVCPELAYSSL